MSTSRFHGLGLGDGDGTVQTIRTAARRFGEPLGVDTVTNIGERFAERIYFRVTPLTSVGWLVVRSTSIVNRGTFVLPVENSFRGDFFGSETIVGVFVG